MPDFIRSSKKEERPEGEQISISKKTRETIRRMAVDGVPPEKIAEMTKLDIKVVRELALAEIAAYIRKENIHKDE